MMYRDKTVREVIRECNGSVTINDGAYSWRGDPWDVADSYRDRLVRDSTSYGDDDLELDVW